VLAAYLVGAIPFGYLTARWLRGIDIRTVGSGNIGATNVGRVMGLRFFFLVFAFDLAKGLLPTLGFPPLVSALSKSDAPPELAVLVALATILGHNFPVYLGFKGGKGVATSLGAVLGLDPVAGLGAALAFGAVLWVWRYVSVASVLGGLTFLVVHFARVSSAWSREQRAMSVLTVALFVMLAVRHRKNFARIAAGTEPKVGRRKEGEDRAGKVAAGWLVGLAAAALLVAAGLTLAARAKRVETLKIGPLTLSEVARASTGYQRAERVAFSDDGRRLAVTCPRYDRLVIYRVTEDDKLESEADVELEGKPVAVCPAADRFYVLQRPSGDRRHVEPGWWDTLNFQGKKVAQRVVVGFYPDDLALSPDQRFAYVLTSGRGEGGDHRPAPALEVFDLSAGPKAVCRLTFGETGDDPARLSLSRTGRAAAVALRGSNTVAAIDLEDPRDPQLIGRTPLAERETPYASATEGDRLLMPVASEGEGVVMDLLGAGEWVACTLPKGSAISFHEARTRRSLGRLTLRTGAFHLGTSRPLGLGFSPSRHLIAVANRSGGVHLVAVRGEPDLLTLRATR
jgi:glycerol-3-phosphate acyltransferase PlsY